MSELLSKYLLEDGHAMTYRSATSRGLHYRRIRAGLFEANTARTGRLLGRASGFLSPVAHRVSHGWTDTLEAGVVEATDLHVRQA